MISFYVLLQYLHASIVEGGQTRFSVKRTRSPHVMTN